MTARSVYLLYVWVWGPLSRPGTLEHGGVELRMVWCFVAVCSRRLLVVPLCGIWLTPVVAKLVVP
jgi:hypothetical protein